MLVLLIWGRQRGKNGDAKQREAAGMDQGRENFGNAKRGPESSEPAGSWGCAVREESAGSGDMRRKQGN